MNYTSSFGGFYKKYTIYKEKAPPKCCAPICTDSTKNAPMVGNIKI